MEKRISIEVDEFTQKQLIVLDELSRLLETSIDVQNGLKFTNEEIQLAVDFGRGEIVAKLYAEQEIRELEEKLEKFDIRT